MSAMAQCGKLDFWALAQKQMFLICSIQNSTRPGHYSNRPAQNALELASVSFPHWWHLKSLASLLFAQPFVQAQIKENIKALRHWPLWGEFTSHPHKGPVAQKMFQFDDIIMNPLPHSPYWVSHSVLLQTFWRKLTMFLRHCTQL